MSEENPIVTLVTAGGEMVGRLYEEDEFMFTLENPRAFVQTKEGVGFAPGVCLTGIRNPDFVSFPKGNVVLMCKTNEEVEKIWIQSTTGIVV